MFDSTDSFGAAIALVEERQDLLSEALHQERFETEKASALRDRLQEVREEMEGTGLIARSSIDSVAKLTTGIESMQRFLANYPVASFTSLPSAVNYHPAMEGIISTIRDTAVKIIKAIWKFLGSVFKGLHNLWKLSSPSYQKAAKVAKNVEKAQVITDEIASAARSVEDNNLRGDIERAWNELTLKMANTTSSNYNALLNWVVGYNKDVMDAEKLLIALYASLESQAADYLTLTSDFISTVESVNKRLSGNHVTENNRLAAGPEFIGRCKWLLDHEALLPDSNVEGIVKEAYGKLRVTNPNGITYFQATYDNFLNWVKDQKNTRYQVAEKAVSQVCDATPVIKVTLDRANVTMGKLTDVMLNIGLRFDKASDAAQVMVNNDNVSDEMLAAAEQVLQRLSSLCSGLNSAHSSIQVILNEYMQALRLRTGYIRGEIGMYQKFLLDKRMDAETRQTINTKLHALKSLLSTYEV